MTTSQISISWCGMRAILLFALTLSSAHIIAAPTVTISANPGSVVSGNPTTLTWSTTEATGCAASGDWSGVKSNSGSQVVTPLKALNSYTLVCSAPTGSASGTSAVGTTLRATFYLSPTGNNSANGTSAATPWKTFAKAFSTMAGGDVLILLDGVYSAAAGIDTGIISYLGTGSGQPPSGGGVNNVTLVRAQNPGNVTIAGGLFIGRSFRKDSFITIQGITFDGNSGGSENGGALYNTSYVTVKDCGFRGGLGVGSNDHQMGNTYALIEDVWVWGSNTRIMLIVYRSNHVVVRRAVVRNDGCLAGAPCGTNTGNAMVGTTIYNSHDVSFQNVIAVDNVLGPAGFGGASDFSIAWHLNFFYPFHRNEWLGTLSVNTGLGASYYYDIDNLPAAAQPMATYRDIVALNTSQGFAANINCGGACPAHDISVRNATFKTASGGGEAPAGLWISSGLAAGAINVQNIIAFGGGSTGVSSPVRPSYVNVNGFSSAYSQLACTTGCYTSNPTADGATPSLRYPTRIESGSLLKGRGLGGADIGANIIFRYGADGARSQDVGYNTLTGTALWPWPNEARIKQQMCAGVTRGFCATGTRLDGVNPVTLTSYIWEQLGNPMPSGIYP